MSTDKHTIETYSATAEQYASHIQDAEQSPLHAFYEKPAMQSLLPDIEGLDVLSIGTGSGEETQWFIENGVASVTGVDIAEGLIYIAADSFPSANFCVMDMNNLAFKNSSFDLLYSSLAMHYVPDWGVTLAEASRVIREGGTFLFSTMHPLETALHVEKYEEQSSYLYGRTIDADTGDRKIIGDYMSSSSGGVRPIIRTVNGEPVVYFHRTFSRMVKDIIASNFEIKSVSEPTPIALMQDANKEHYEQVLRQPKFIIWELQVKAVNE